MSQIHDKMAIRPQNLAPEPLQSTGTDSAIERPMNRKNPTSHHDSTVLHDEDTEWIEQCRQGNTVAYGMLVEKYKNRVYNVCWRMCGHQADAEDLTQEAFIKAFESLDRFDGRAKFYTWLFRIAVNLTISAHRKRRRLRTISLDTAATSEEDEGDWIPSKRLSTEEASPLREAMARETHRLIIDALESLDEEFRIVVVLRDIESLPYDEIADILGVPPGTVKSRLHRGRMAVRHALQPILDES